MLGSCGITLHFDILVYHYLRSLCQIFHIFIIQVHFCGILCSNDSEDVDVSLPCYMIVLPFRYLSVTCKSRQHYNPQDLYQQMMILIVSMYNIQRIRVDLLSDHIDLGQVMCCFLVEIN